MSQAPVLPMFVDAMIGDTLHLDMEAFGCYHMILYATWRANGSPLPDDDVVLARVCRMPAARWRKVRIILAPFFDLSGGTWRQGRLEREWTRVSEAARVARENGARGGRPPRKPPEHEPTGNPSLNPEPNQNVSKTKASLTLTEPINQTPPSETVVEAGLVAAVIGVVDDVVQQHFGVRSVRHIHDRSIAEGWIEQGMRPDGVRAVVEPIVAKRKRAGEDAPGSLKFFLNPMQRAIAAGAAAAKPSGAAIDPEQEAAAKRYSDAVNAWADNGREGPSPTPEQFGWHRGKARVPA